MFLNVDVIWLRRYPMHYFSCVLQIPMESSVNWSNEHAFVRRNYKELWGNLASQYLVNEAGDRYFLFYISTNYMINSKLWKFDKNQVFSCISEEWRENNMKRGRQIITASDFLLHRVNFLGVYLGNQRRHVALALSNRTVYIFCVNICFSQKQKG